MKDVIFFLDKAKIKATNAFRWLREYDFAYPHPLVSLTFSRLIKLLFDYKGKMMIFLAWYYAKSATKKYIFFCPEFQILQFLQINFYRQSVSWTQQTHIEYFRVGSWCNRQLFVDAAVIPKTIGYVFHYQLKRFVIEYFKHVQQDVG